MIGRLVLAALIAGMAAGFIYGGVQHVQTTPLILAAEVYETAPAHDHGAAAADQATPTTAHAHEEEEWAPADGWPRTLSTTVSSMITGAGFALLLAGVSLLTGLPITPKNGLIWGICGFLAATVAPGAGLAPELPGMPAGDLVLRQVWWVATIIASGVGIFLIATKRELIWLAAAVVLIALPHIIGAPQPLTHESAVPAGLAASFVANTIAASAVLWSLIGLFLGLALQKFGKDVYAS
ncbi:MAG TPA: CbtA family protein [Aestuariivirga sp.]|nr:CbtA family protein [Aestuariivirga sp.]